jgi:hypothetical protein
MMSVLLACAFSLRREYIDITIPNFASEYVNNRKSSIRKSDPSDVNPTLLTFEFRLGSLLNFDF